MHVDLAQASEEDKREASVKFDWFDMSKALKKTNPTVYYRVEDTMHKIKSEDV